MDSNNSENAAKLKKQAGLFFKISKINEEHLSVEQLLTTAVDILADSWICPAYAAIEFGNLNITSKNFTETTWQASASVTVNDQKNLFIRLYHREKQTFSDVEQTLLNTVAVSLGSKTERVLSRLELEENQQLLDKAYKLARIGTWEYDMINDVLHWSDMTKEVHGFGKDYVPDVESTIQLFKEGFNRDTFARAANDAIEKEKPFDVELKIISGKGDERWIRATGEPEYKDGVCVRFYGISQNVTSRRKAQEDLQLSERRFKALVQDASDMIAIVDEEANIKYASPASIKVLGIPPEDFAGKNALDFIHKEDKERTFHQLVSLSYKESTIIRPYRFRDAAGNWRWLETTLTNLTEDPAVKGYVANSRDVTRQQLRQEKMEGSLKEKETLLAEIHHRIKNNLSVLTSLLQIQASDEKNREVINRLSDSVARIHTMSTIHEQLYQSRNYSSLELSDRIRLLALNIQKTMQFETHVQIHFECEPVQLNLNQVLPCSLILNEVITNIFKYAFKGREKGEIYIRLKKAGNNKVHLVMADNGIGLPQDFSAEQSSSLGLSLIHSLTSQLKGEYDFSSTENGTTFTLLFEQQA